MTDRPIIFSPPMIRALLAGRKTQTRRILLPGPQRMMCRSCGVSEKEFKAGACQCEPTDLQWTPCDCPIWRKDDRLWVRERGWISKSKLAFQPWVGNEGPMTPQDPAGTPYKVCPSIHMPRWASRLTLPVKQVRVERLQDISEEDARAEGAMLHVPCKSAVGGTCLPSDSWYFDQSLDGRLYEDTTARGAFEILWGKINGWKSWDANPWVAAISFDVTKTNIDA